VQRAAFLVIVAVLVFFVRGIRAESPSKTKGTHGSSDPRKMTDANPTRAQLTESANGWMYVNGEWVHPDGYKFVNHKVLRTTAKTGKAFPKPPNKLALDNAAKLTPPTKSSAFDDAKTAAEKAADMRRKNLTPTPASQTGTHL
jgi:hypothetical protein